MAKKKSRMASANGKKTNKAAAVRQFLDANPTAKASDVIDSLKSQGIDVSANYVSVIKSKRLAQSSTGRKSRTTSNKSTRNELDAAVELARACRWDFGTARHFLALVEQVHVSLK